MAIVSEETLKKAVQIGKTNLFVLFGEDGYLKKLYVDKIAKNIAPSDDVFNYQRFEADSSLQEVYDAVQQFPMMSDKKVVILRDYKYHDCDSKDYDKLISLLSDVPETTVLIVWFDALDIDLRKNPRFDKIIKTVDSVTGVTVNLSHRKGPELEKMLIDGAAKRGVKMEIGAARYLVEVSGDDISTLRNELDKLCAYVDGDVITKEIIARVSVRTVESDIYSLTDKILKCELQAAYAILDDLFFMRVEPIVILSTISSVYVDMHRVLSARSKKVSKAEIAEIFGYGRRTFALDKAEYNLKKFDFNKLQLSFKALAAADVELKSFSGNDRIVLEKLIVQLSYIAVKGESVD